MQQGWQKVKFGELFHVKHGYAFKSKFFSDSGPYIVLTPGNFYDKGGFKDKGEKEKFYIGEVPDGYLLKQNELLVAMTEQTRGLLGSAILVPEDDLYLHNQRLGLVENFREEQLNKKFLYYLFNTYEVREQIQASANGAKVRHTSPSRIYEVEVALPPLETQKRIADILSAYDDLLENNTRRIKLLEQMAQLIYLEWFVDFRFPGHEEMERVESEVGLVPEEWRVCKLGDVLELAYGKGLTKKNRVPGAYPVYGSSGVVDTHEKSLVEGPGIIVGRKGNVGSVFWEDKDFYPIDTVFYVVSDYSLHFFYYNLQHQRFLNSDAAVPGLNRNQALSNPVVLPPNDLTEAFEAQVKPIFRLVRILNEKNQNLRQTRDLLLPKLISGELDVSGIEQEAEAVGV